MNVCEIEIEKKSKFTSNQLHNPIFDDLKSFHQTRHSKSFSSFEHCKRQQRPRKQKQSLRTSIKSNKEQ